MSRAAAAAPASIPALLLIERPSLGNGAGLFVLAAIARGNGSGPDATQQVVATTSPPRVAHGLTLVPVARDLPLAGPERRARAMDAGKDGERTFLHGPTGCFQPPLLAVKALSPQLAAAEPVQPLCPQFPLHSWVAGIEGCPG